MNRNVLMGIGAVVLVGAGFVVSDHMRLRAEVEAKEEPSVAQAKPSVPSDPTATPSESPVAEPEPPAEPSPEPEQQQQIIWLDADFEDFPARRYTGPQQPLQMTAEQRSFRTRLRDAYATPVSFGGSMNVAMIGCGTSCVFYYMIDKSSGKVLRFPLGGESQMGLRLNYRPDSALIWAKWEEDFGANRACKAQPWTLGANGFRAESGISPVSCD